MTDILCLNKDELSKSNLIVFNNLDFFAILKIVFKFNDKNKFKYVIINNPKIKIYKFLSGIGYKIRLLDFWNGKKLILKFLMKLIISSILICSMSKLPLVTHFFP